MPYVAPSTVTTLQTYTSAAHNVIVGDIIDHETRINDTGMAIVTPTSVSGTGVTLSNGKVSFSASTAISVNGVFSTAYEHYFVMLNLKASANGLTVNMRFRASGSDISSALYNWAYMRLGSNLTAYNTAGASATEIMIGNADSTGRTGIAFDVFNPNTTETRKVVASRGGAYQTGITSFLTIAGGGECASATAFDGFTIFPNTADNFTGSLRVYGYQNS
jgi:hypothetical protein